MSGEDDGGLRRRYALAERDLEEEHVLWQLDRIELRSVGIDIGSSTSHMIFSTLEMRRQGAALSSRFELTGRRVDYESEILITPFVDGNQIDTERLSDFLQACYRTAGIHPTQVDTGAVITTGDAARKDNAAAIVQLFSEQAGQFVCASAGPLLEAKMAAYGSGAVARSAEQKGMTVLNVDVGGGTSKLALLRNGQVCETAAINVGARLITLDEQRRVTKIESAAAIAARHCGLELALGQVLSESGSLTLAKALGDSLLQAAAQKVLSPLTTELMITSPLSDSGTIDAVLFSGGVSEYFYETEPRSFSDLGPVLGATIRDLTSQYFPNVVVEAPSQRIRATVIGASQFTAQVSGNTIYIKNPALLPLRNVQVVTVRFNDNDLSLDGMRDVISQALESAEASLAEEPVALALHWPYGPAYQPLRTLCRALAAALEQAVRFERPLIIVLDCDIARLVGANLSEVLAGYSDIICIDGVQLQEFDYIDVSEEHVQAGVVTVMIKSLVFTG